MDSKEKNTVNNPFDKPTIPTLKTEIPKTIHPPPIKNSLPTPIKEPLSSSPKRIEKT